MAREATLRGKAWQSVSWLALGEATREAAPLDSGGAPLLADRVGEAHWGVAASLHSGGGSPGHPESGHRDAAAGLQVAGITPDLDWRGPTMRRWRRT